MHYKTYCSFNCYKFAKFLSPLMPYLDISQNQCISTTLLCFVKFEDKELAKQNSMRIRYCLKYKQLISCLDCNCKRRLIIIIIIAFKKFVISFRN